MDRKTCTHKYNKAIKGQALFEVLLLTIPLLLFFFAGVKLFEKTYLQFKHEAPGSTATPLVDFNFKNDLIFLRKEKLKEKLNEVEDGQWSKVHESKNPDYGKLLLYRKNNQWLIINKNRGIVL